MIGQRAKLALNAGWSLLLLLLLVHTVLLAVLFVRGPAVAMLMCGRPSDPSLSPHKGAPAGRQGSDGAEGDWSRRGQRTVGPGVAVLDRTISSNGSGVLSEGGWARVGCSWSMRISTARRPWSAGNWATVLSPKNSLSS